MTHKEIERAIGKLRELTACSSKIMGSAIIGAIVGYLSTDDACDKLIELLEQADPDTHMELPVASDGVPIHIGDELDCGEHFGVQEVEGFIHGAVAFTVCDPLTTCDPQPARICTCPAHMTHHYHKLTVEDVLGEFVARWHETHHDDMPELLTNYAAKLREVIADE